MKSGAVLVRFPWGWYGKQSILCFSCQVKSITRYFKGDGEVSHIGEPLSQMRNHLGKFIFDFSSGFL